MSYLYFASNIQPLLSKYLTHILFLPLLPHSFLEVPITECLTSTHKEALHQSMEFQVSSLALTSSVPPSLTQLEKLYQVTTALSVVPPLSHHLHPMTGEASRSKWCYVFFEVLEPPTPLSRASVMFDIFSPFPWQRTDIPAAKQFCLCLGVTQKVLGKRMLSFSAHDLSLPQVELGRRPCAAALSSLSLQSPFSFGPRLMLHFEAFSKRDGFRPSSGF